MRAYGKQFRRDKWVSASDVMIYAYQDLCSISSKKPIMFAEWGIGEYPDSGDKAQWIMEAFALMKTRFPRLKAAVFWSERWENDDGSYMANRESSTSWKDFLLGLKTRGPQGVFFAVSDDHPGLKRAIMEVLPEAYWQCCYVHFLRNALDFSTICHAKAATTA
jgi:hypothetical protein